MTSLIFFYLLLTILAELPVHALFLRSERFWQVAMVCVFLNGFTQPLANLGILAGGMDYWLMEGLVLVVEAAVLIGIWRMKIWRGALLATVANAASIGLGWLLIE